MPRTVIPLIAGAILGAGGMWLTVEETPRSADRPGPESRTGTTARVGRTQLQNARSVADRLAVFESAAAETDLAALEQSLARAARAGGSAAADLEVDALLMRIAELVPRRAAELALALELAPRFVIEAYLSWAQAEPGAALTALAGIRDAGTRRDVAVALLAVFGDWQGMERVAVALPENERLAFAVDALAFRAASDPTGALYEAQRLGDPTFRREALVRIAGVWATQDPIGALEQADLLTPDLATYFRTTVAQQWARVDGAGLVGYLETEPYPERELVQAAASIASVDVDRLLALADSMPDELASEMRASVVVALAERDGDAAAAQVNAMAPGEERDQVIARAGFVLATADPGAAAGWLREVTSLSPDTVRSVATTVMRSDPASALELLDLVGDAGPKSGIEATVMLWAMSSAAVRDAEHAARIAERLLARGDAIGKAALDRVISEWAEVDPGSAAAWALNLDQGAVRDDALGRLLSSRAAGTGELDRGLLESISSEAGRQRALRDAVLALASKDRAAARVLVEREVDDIETRRALERAIDSLPIFP